MPLPDPEPALGHPELQTRRLGLTFPSTCLDCSCCTRTQTQTGTSLILTSLRTSSVLFCVVWVVCSALLYFQRETKCHYFPEKEWLLALDTHHSCHHLSSWELSTHWVWLIASIVNEFERREMVWSAQVRSGREITVWKLTWAARHFLTITPLHKVAPWGGISGVTGLEGGHLLFYKKYQSFFPISFAWISLVTGPSDGKLITVTQCFKANPSKLLVKFCFLFVWFYRKRWEEGGNIVQNSVLSSTEWNWYGFII